MIDLFYKKAEAMISGSKDFRNVKGKVTFVQKRDGVIVTAEIYGLQVMENGIQNDKNNSTRFIIVSGKKVTTRNANRISICFEIPHESGSLYHMLSHFIYNDINLVNIQSRPIRDRNWEYRFFVDFEGKFTDTAVLNALRRLSEETLSMKILGTY